MANQQPESNDQFEIKAALQVLKPAPDVFDAIIDPVKMSNYFISESNGRMETGKSLVWKFPEMDVAVPVHVERTEPDKHISFIWGDTGTEQLVTISLSPRKDNTATLINITEKTIKGNADIGWLKRNTEGWANFLACLKAYLEYGINLRKGAFDFMHES